MAVTRMHIREQVQEALGNHIRLEDSIVDRLLQKENLIILEAEQWMREQSEVLVVVPAKVSPTDGGFTQDASTVLTSASTAAWVGRSLRRGTDKYFFDITAVDAGVSATIETAWPDVTASSQTFTVFPRLITPHSDAQEILEVWCGDRALDKAERVSLNRRDPAREDVASQPRVWAPAVHSAADVPRIEIWPRVESALPLRIVYERSGALNTSQSIPVYPPYLLGLRGEAAAAMHIWSKTNVDGWRAHAQMKLEEYTNMLHEAVGTNRARLESAKKVRGPYSTTFGYDSDYLLNHDVGAWY